MAQAIRQTAIVTSEEKIEIQSSQLHLGEKIDVMIIFEEPLENSSAEALAIQRLKHLDNPSQLITVIDADQEMDEESLQAWATNHGQKA